MGKGNAEVKGYVRNRNITLCYKEMQVTTGDKATKKFNTWEKMSMSIPNVFRWESYVRWFHPTATSDQRT